MSDEKEPGPDTPPDGETPQGEHEEITDEHIAEVAKTDPDKAEHLKARQKQHEPKQGGERWNKIYAEAMELRRNKEKYAELDKKIAEQDADIKALREHNKQIIESLKAPETKKEAKEAKKDAESQIADLRAAKKSARNNLDYDKADEIQDQIDDLLIAMNKAAKTNPDDVKKQTQQAIQEASMEEAVQDFLKGNSWFAKVLPDGKPNPDYDFVKSGAAQALEKDLLPDWKGTYRELLKKVEADINDRFKEKSPERQKIPAAAGVGGGLAASGKIALTAAQRRVAQLMFEDDPKAEERYMAQLEIMKGRG